MSGFSLQQMKSLQTQSGGDVNVEVNAAPGEDLLKKLNNMRQEYENIIQKNREEVEKWYEGKVSATVWMFPFPKENTSFGKNCLKLNDMLNDNIGCFEDRMLESLY